MCNNFSLFLMIYIRKLRKNDARINVGVDVYECLIHGIFEIILYLKIFLLYFGALN